MARLDSVDVSSASTDASAHSGITFSNLDYSSMFGARSLACAPELLFCRATGEDGAPIIVPESAGRRGAFPEFIHCEGHWQQWDCLVTRMRDEQANGHVLNDMAIIYRNNTQAEAAERALAQAGIAYASGTSSKGRGELYGSEDSVKIVSMHSSKGLEFGLVLIPALGEMPK